VTYFRSTGKPGVTIAPSPEWGNAADFKSVTMEPTTDVIDPDRLATLRDPEKAYAERETSDAWDDAIEAGLVFEYWHPDDVGGPWGPTHLGLTEEGQAMLELLEKAGER
jgi:hypothetical protein